MGPAGFWKLLGFVLTLFGPIARLILDTIEFITGFEWLTIVLDVVLLLIASGQVWLKWKRKISLPKPNQHKQDTEEGHLDLSNLDAFHHNDRKSLGECWYMKLQFTMKHTLK